jgi:hypothetical protein
MRALRQFSLRDGLWLMVVVALTAVWLAEKRTGQLRELEHQRALKALETQTLSAEFSARQASRMAHQLDMERLQRESLARRLEQQ